MSIFERLTKDYTSDYNAPEMNALELSFTVFEKKEIDVAKNVQRIIVDPKGISLTDRIRRAMNHQQFGLIPRIRRAMNEAKKNKASGLMWFMLGALIFCPTGIAIGILIGVSMMK